MKTLITITAIISLFFSSCASTTLYKDGKKIANFQGDMTGVEYHMSQNGDVTWKSTTTNHSTATLAQGAAATSKIQAGGAAIGAAGITALIKK